MRTNPLPKLWVRCFIAVGLLSLTACPPVRENVTGAEGGGYGEPAFFAYRQSNYGESPQWGIVFIPRDEDHDCNRMLSYDWNDADQDYARLQISKARALDWEGEFVNSYTGGCGGWYDSDRRCFDGFDYREGEYVVHQELSVLVVDAYDNEKMRGSVTDDAGERLGFSAENCGELPYYYAIGSEDEAVPETGRARTPDDVRARARSSRWGLRFR